MLNHAQQQAVRVPGHALITACPGSGKTTVLMHRAVHLLGGHPGSILGGVTFTSEAAAELDGRIRKQLPSVGDRLICGTFHSLCKRQLTRHGHRFSLIDENKQQDLLRRAYMECVVSDTPFEDAVRFIEKYKGLVDPMLPYAEAPDLCDMLQHYQEFLARLGAKDFSDLLVDCVRGMRAGDIRPLGDPEGKPVRFLLVDEFQDTDEVQFAWIREHIRQGVEVTVVGDDDQSVYSFRSALSMEAFTRFKALVNPTHISLDLTYRCAREIITPAHSLINCNHDRFQKSLTTANRGKGQVKIHRYPKEAEEVDDILAHIARSGEWGQWGVLARTNALLDPIERELLGEKIDYVRSGGTSFWEYRSPALFLGVCQSIGSNDMIGIDQLMRKIGVSESDISKVHSSCRSRQAGSLNRFLEGAITSNPHPNDKLGTMRKRLAEWNNMIAGRNAGLAFEGMARYIVANADLFKVSARKAIKKANDPKALMAGVDSDGMVVTERERLMLEQCASSMSRLSGDVRARLMALRKGEKGDDKTDAVRLMTLHSSKGLEFERVWIVGCQQGVCPSEKSKQEGLLEEERRLFYVGMTRAKHDLHLSYVIDKKTDTGSQFLTEAGLI